MKRIAVIGAGASGMMCAISAAECGADVTVYERNEKPGKKLFITGKGRCNLTNACDASDFFDNVISNPRFLYSAVYSFDPYAVMDFFEKNGLRLKAERGNRVFPESDHSSDVIKTLTNMINDLGVDLRLNEAVTDVIARDGCVKVVASKPLKGKADREEYDSVVIAAGGLSYPLTGACDDGYAFAKRLGHSINPLYPSLVSLRLKEKGLSALTGLSLRNVALSVKTEKKELYGGFGELLFTQTGMSGPLALSASAVCGRHIAKGNELLAYIDLKPALSVEKLDARILREFEEAKNKNVLNAIVSMYPANMRQYILNEAKIPPDKKVHDVSRQERKALIKATKEFPVTITGTDGFERAVVTGGGVDVREVDPSTMESKLIKGLYFTGEVLDVDALTGGYNLQIAWSTGHLAGMCAAATERR